ncbi:MAG: hypothetical protein E7561_02475 [Ruminococcaceae bacterium]|nr:hypothetical protein [Oscillospiraceae bacterium]
MKRTLALALVLLMLLVFAGCDAKSNDSSEKQDSISSVKADAEVNRELKVKSTIMSDEKIGDLYYEESKNVAVQDVRLDLGIGEEIVIGALSDIHYNYCNKRDFSERDPVIMSTYKNRKWLQYGYSAGLAKNCMDLLDGTVDLMVFNGDTLDYLSHGAREIMQRDIWDRYPNAIATLGNHEAARQMQGEVPDIIPLEKRLDTVREFWKHDIDYTTRLIKGKLLVIGLNDAYNVVSEEVLQNFKNDIANARKAGQKILLFMHVPVATGNPEHTNIDVGHPAVLNENNTSDLPLNFCDGVNDKGLVLLGNPRTDDTSKEFCKVLTNNADVVKGVFTGHLHNAMYLEILAKNPDGSSAIIPQYVMSTTASGSGYMMRIFVK